MKLTTTNRQESQEKYSTLSYLVSLLTQSPHLSHPKRLNHQKNVRARRAGSFVSFVLRYTGSYPIISIQ